MFGLLVGLVQRLAVVGAQVRLGALRMVLMERTREEAVAAVLKAMHAQKHFELPVLLKMEHGHLVAELLVGVVRALMVLGYRICMGRNHRHHRLEHSIEGVPVVEVAVWSAWVAVELTRVEGVVEVAASS